MGYRPCVSFGARQRGAELGKGDAMKYEAPKVVDYGTLVQLTAGQQTGDFTDKDFPAHTPRGDLTFS